jgi:hypothetical protein
MIGATGFWLAHPQLRMLAAPPMDRQNDLAHLGYDPDGPWPDLKWLQQLGKFTLR